MLSSFDHPTRNAVVSHLVGTRVADICPAEYLRARIYGYAETVWKAKYEFHPTGSRRNRKVVMTCRLTSSSQRIRLVDALAIMEANSILDGLSLSFPTPADSVIPEPLE